MSRKDVWGRTTCTPLRTTALNSTCARTHSVPPPAPGSRRRTLASPCLQRYDFASKHTDVHGMGDINQRKSEHLDIVLGGLAAGRPGSSGFDAIRFEHCALPELNLDNVDVSTTFLGRALKAPYLVSSMTGGRSAPRPSTSPLRKPQAYSASPSASARNVLRSRAARAPASTGVCGKSRARCLSSPTSGPLNWPRGTASPWPSAPST